MATTNTLTQALSRPALVRGAAAGLVLSAAIAGLAACDIQVRENGSLKVGLFSAQATDDWTRTYPLAAGGRIEVANLNGPIEVSEAAAGGNVEVHASIIAKALTDAVAKEILSKGRIEETTSPAGVKIETVMPKPNPGSYEVRYQIKVPAGVEAQVSTTNGSVKATGLTGKLKASVVNGPVELNDMAGALDATSVNGPVSVKLTNVTAPVRLETTNGRLTLELPKASRANLSARVVNGGLTVSGLQVQEQRGNRIRNLETVLNGGGPPIDLRATNGRMTITGTE
jgi:putative adhesin